MKTLYMHIGHKKTGSSFLQSAFRLNRTLLKKNGIFYPLEPEESANDSNRISSGNGKGFVLSEQNMHHQLSSVYSEPAVDSLLLSSEFLFEEILQTSTPRSLGEVAMEHGFERIAILLFIRNPIEYASSIWQQGVKRHGYFHELSNEYEQLDLIEKVRNVIFRLSSDPLVKLNVMNYSIVRDRILTETERWLGLPTDTLASPSVGKVNRSMTWAELQLLVALNRRLGPCGGVLADPLCERLPDLPADDVRPPREVQSALLARLKPSIDHVNAHLPDEHKYAFEIQPPTEGRDHATFTLEQVDVIADGFADEINRLRQEIANLRTNPEESLPFRALLRGVVLRFPRAVRSRLAAVSKRPRSRRSRKTR